MYSLKVLYGETALRSSPFLFYIPFNDFGQKKNPFVYPPLKNGTPLTYLQSNLFNTDNKGTEPSVRFTKGVRFLVVGNA